MEGWCNMTEQRQAEAQEPTEPLTPEAPAPGGPQGWSEPNQEAEPGQHYPPRLQHEHLWGRTESDTTEAT